MARVSKGVFLTVLPRSGGCGSGNIPVLRTVRKGSQNGNIDIKHKNVKNSQDLPTPRV